MMPKISVITISYNNVEGLKKTLESVTSQDYKDFEYIVIDGGSKDRSKELLEEYSDKISYWVSEPDKGIYNAMNKGVEASTGEYLLMLNSGDTFFDTHTIRTILEHPLDKDIIYGDVQWIENGQSNLQTFPKTLTFSFFTVAQRSLAHQSTMIRRELHYKYCFYDEGFKIISDWAFFVMVICKYNCSYKHIDLVVSSCDRDGISCNPNFFPVIEKEKNEFLKREFSTFLDDYEKSKKQGERIRYLENSSLLQAIKMSLRKTLHTIKTRKSSH